jgi:hypothetical protein
MLQREPHRPPQRPREVRDGGIVGDDEIETMDDGGAINKSVGS